MNKEDRKKVKDFAKKHWISLGGLGLGLMLINWWLSNAMAREPFFHFIVITFLVNAIAGFGYIRIYFTLTKDRDDEGTKKDS